MMIRTGTRPDKARPYGLSEGDWDDAVIPVGYAAKMTEAPKKRPLETITRYLD